MENKKLSDSICLKLKGKHMFKFSKILRKLEVKPEKDIYVKDIDIANAVGANLIFSIITNLDKAEEDINLFISEISGIQLERIEEAEFDEYIDLIVSIFKSSKFSGFFNKALQLAKKLN